MSNNPNNDYIPAKGAINETQMPLDPQIEPQKARIPTRSRRQAMDWSLVLVSQGIEPVIERPDEFNGWGLSVAPEEHGRALEIIRLYRSENRRWGLRHPIAQTGFVFDWSSLSWVILICFFYWLDVRVDLRTSAMVHPADVRHGAWWQLFTAVWLHAHIAHLASNGTIGFILLGLACGRFGAGPALLMSYIAGAGGNLLRAIFPVNTAPGLGASGMVMGALGLLAVQSLSLWRQRGHPRKFLLTTLGTGIALFILLGLSPDSDVTAHFGGFACGLLLGQLLLLKAFARPWIKVLCGALFLAATLLPWALALRR